MSSKQKRVTTCHFCGATNCGKSLFVQGPNSIVCEKCVLSLSKQNTRHSKQVKQSGDSACAFCAKTDSLVFLNRKAMCTDCLFICGRTIEGPRFDPFELRSNSHGCLLCGDSELSASERFSMPFGAICRPCLEGALAESERVSTAVSASSYRYCAVCQSQSENDNRLFERTKGALCESCANIIYREWQKL